MRKVFAAIVLLWMAACRNPQRIGEELFPPTPTRQDTLRIEGVRQVFLPPPSTKKAPFVFMGEAEDTFTGRWKAGWATSFALGGKDVKFFSQTLVAVDSVILELFIASAYGDFSVPMRVRVERLTQPLSNAQSYTTTTTFSTDGQNLVLPGRDSLYFISLRPGGYRIPLDTNLGRSILTLPASALSGEEAFQQAFPGLYITAEPMVAGAKAAIYTIFPRSASTVLRIFYRERVQGQDAPQRYDFFVNDSCVWAYSLQRQSTNTLRDHLEQDTTLWAQQLLVAGGLPVGIQFEVSGWEALSRRPVLAARLIWFSDSVGDNSYSPFYPRPTSFVLYADTIEEAASAAWGFGDYTNASVIWELTQPIQEIALRRRLPPKHFYIWLSGRSYTLQRWLAAGLRSSHPPYLIVTSAEP